MSRSDPDFPAIVQFVTRSNNHKPIEGKLPSAAVRQTRFQKQVEAVENGLKIVTFDPHLLEAQAAGNPELMCFVGDCRLHGLRLRRDAPEAARWYLRAAQLGHAPAFSRLTEPDLGFPHQQAILSADKAVELGLVSPSVLHVAKMSLETKGYHALDGAPSLRAVWEQRVEGLVKEQQEHSSTLQKCSALGCSVSGTWKHGGRLLRCPCSQVYYCSMACQKNDWKRHKLVCSSRKTTKEDASTSSSSKAGAEQLPHCSTQLVTLDGTNAPRKPKKEKPQQLQAPVLQKGTDGTLTPKIFSTNTLDPKTLRETTSALSKAAMGITFDAGDDHHRGMGDIQPGERVYCNEGSGFLGIAESFDATRGTWWCRMDGWDITIDLPASSLEVVANLDDLKEEKTYCQCGHVLSLVTQDPDSHGVQDNLLAFPYADGTEVVCECGVVVPWPDSGMFMHCKSCGANKCARCMIIACGGGCLLSS